MQAPEEDFNRSDSLRAGSTTHSGSAVASGRRRSDTEGRRVSRLLDGQLDVFIAIVLATFTVLLHLAYENGTMGAALLDLTAFSAAALMVRWPKAAGLLLAAVLVGLLFTPAEWPTMAEYAPMIPLLGSGLRDKRRLRLWIVLVYGPILTAVLLQDLEGHTLWRKLIGLGFWATMFAFVWVIGDLFTAYRRAQEKARVAHLQRQRVELARELHDTVARELSRASLHAQTAMQGDHLAELEPVLAGIQRASSQLRLMMFLLREPNLIMLEDPPLGLSQVIDQGEQTLVAKGFTVTRSVDGHLSRLSSAASLVLRCAVEEVCANIERHADPSQPCAIVFSVDDSGIDGVFINGILATACPSPHGMGLTGIRERLNMVGGELVAGSEGSQWITRISMPL